MSEVATRFFLDDCPTGFTLDEESQAWKDVSQPGKKSLTNEFTAFKCGVRMILLHAGAFPSTLDKKSLENVTKPAEEKIRNDFQFDKEETDHSFQNSKA